MTDKLMIRSIQYEYDPSAAHEWWALVMDLLRESAMDESALNVHTPNDDGNIETEGEHA